MEIIAQAPHAWHCEATCIICSTRLRISRKDLLLDPDSTEDTFGFFCAHCEIFQALHEDADRKIPAAQREDLAIDILSRYL